MNTKGTSFLNALVSNIDINSPKNIKAQVEKGVMKRCVERGLLHAEDKCNKSKNYRLVLEVIDNDLPALCLLRKENPKVLNSSDLRDFLCDMDDICEEVVIRIANRILDRKIE